jgi:hypothetical protein
MSASLAADWLSCRFGGAGKTQRKPGGNFVYSTGMERLALE